MVKGLDIFFVANTVRKTTDRIITSVYSISILRTNTFGRKSIILEIISALLVPMYYIVPPHLRSYGIKVSLPWANYRLNLQPTPQGMSPRRFLVKKQKCTTEYARPSSVLPHVGRVLELNGLKSTSTISYL